MAHTSTIVREKSSTFKKGIDYQREQFKASKDGSGQNNFDMMCDAIENIKSEIKTRVIKKGNSEKIKRIEKIIVWYRTLEKRYTVKTEQGYMVRFPPNIDEQINHNLTVAFELLMHQLDMLDLL